MAQQKWYEVLEAYSFCEGVRCRILVHYAVPFRELIEQFEWLHVNAISLTLRHGGAMLEYTIDIDPVDMDVTEESEAEDCAKTLGSIIERWAEVNK